MVKHNKFVNNKEFLILLAGCHKKLRNSIISNCNKEQILAVIECILNVLNGNIQIDNTTLQKLRPFNKTFKKLLDKKTGLKIKRKIIVQKGGFLQFLIPAIVSGIASIVSSVISSNKQNE